MDSDSFSLLEHLLDAHGIAIVFSSRKIRSEDRSHTDLMARARKLTLRAFSVSECEHFVTHKLNVEGLDKHILSFLHARADGIPATLSHLLDSLMENLIFEIDSDDRWLRLNPNKVTDPGQLSKLETPDSVRALIRTQIAKLDPKSLDLLFVASTIGRYFRFGLLDGALRYRGGEASRVGLPTRVLKSLIDGGVLGVEDQSRTRSAIKREDVVLYFCSGATHRAVYEMQSEGGSSANHLAIAQALQGELTRGKVQSSMSLSKDRSTRRTRNAVSSSRRRRGSRRRGSIAPMQEQQRGETELFPKIAHHLEHAGKKLKALEYYFGAGRALEESGLVGAADMFQQCLVISEVLGDECSSFMRAEYAFHLSHALISSGQNAQAQEAAKQTLNLLGEDVNPSTWNLLSGLTVLWLEDNTCWGTSEVAASELKELELMVLTLSIYSLACSNSSQTMAA